MSAKERTPEQNTDEALFREFKKLLRSAKRKAAAAQAAEDEVFRLIECMGIVPDSVPTNAENADNLQDAITCYLSYDEYSEKGIISEVQEAYFKNRSKL